MVEVGFNRPAGAKQGPALDSRPWVHKHWGIPHDGDPKGALTAALQRLDPSSYDRIAATGRKFLNAIKLPSISEIEAVAHAYRFVEQEYGPCNAIVSAGGENLMVYEVDEAGQTTNIITGNKCASGTGEFFFQQLRRMNVSAQQAEQWAVTEEPYPVSGRCSVFCKSDCTHSINKGIPKANVAAGIYRMIADKISELLTHVSSGGVMMIGGMTRNRTLVELLRRSRPEISVPQQATYFEALGAALWAYRQPEQPFPGLPRLFNSGLARFPNLPPLLRSLSRVHFKSWRLGRIVDGDVCILGVDVGSTTTKAVLMREADNAVLAKVYLRTNGNPINAATRCYREIWTQIRAHVQPSRIVVTGLGVCGSGRQIVGLHAQTDGVINEIISHATAAVYFDPEVDTVFEIGGQDAKYTYIRNGVPVDYAMNEACSAGTGSFLEESASETMGIGLHDIADLALRSRSPLSFNDQCAAFIAADIKNAIHEGAGRDDIVGGLVHSVCLNYVNRVKANRPVGRRILMQGGVCYNRAVPAAMAAIIGKPVVVPPEPGMAGAFGVALEVKKRIAMGLMQAGRFDMEALAGRTARLGKTWICHGKGEQCDRRCRITNILINGRPYPFGGGCNKYDNLRSKGRCDTSALNLVGMRQRRIFIPRIRESNPANQADRYRRIGFNKSFMLNEYYPLYATFFEQLGFKPVLPRSPSPQGLKRCASSFCFPGELAHGFFYTLLTSCDSLDALFLPHLKTMPSCAPEEKAQLCPLVQAEPYYLRAAFNRDLDLLRSRGTKVLTPVIEMESGLEDAAGPLTAAGRALGATRDEAEAAFERAVAAQRQYRKALKEAGLQKLEELAVHPDRIGTVIFARPYNGFVDEAHLGIPNKLASRGVLVLPFDCLPEAESQNQRNMYWGMGQRILRAADMVRRHPQLFGVYITNFSCGPDSFLLGYFRNLMADKPSLVLELDSHTADAGIETRIEAFLDIVTIHRKRHPVARAKPVPALGRGNVRFGEPSSLADQGVTLLFPAMGRLSNEAVAAATSSTGIRCIALQAPNERILKLGRAHTSGKECLPLALVTGMLLDYLHNRRKSGESVVYFLPTASGPCRFGQYAIFLEDLLQRENFTHVSLMSFTSDNAYGGLGNRFNRMCWWALVTSDVMEDIRSVLLADAVDPAGAMATFEREWSTVLASLRRGRFSALHRQLTRTALNLRRIRLARPVSEVPLIALIGEIFVRRDPLSRQHLTERLADRGFAATCAPISEWLYYARHLQNQGSPRQVKSAMSRLKSMSERQIMRHYERLIKGQLSVSGLVAPHMIDIDALAGMAAPHISPELVGETVLTVGSALAESEARACGVIALGPFGCIPGRIAESILVPLMRGNGHGPAGLQGGSFPFLSIECDGTAFPQVVDIRLEAFLARARHLHASGGNMRKPHAKGRSAARFVPRSAGPASGE